MNRELEIMNVQGIDCYEKDGIAYLKLDAVARGLGFTQWKNSIEYVRWDRIDQYLSETGFPTSGERPDFIPENIFYRLDDGKKWPSLLMRVTVDEDGKLTEQIVLSGQNHAVIFINESNLYSLILSRLMRMRK